MEITFKTKNNFLLRPSFYKDISLALRALGLIGLFTAFFTLPYASFTVPQKALIWLIGSVMGLELFGIVFPVISNLISKGLTWWQEKTDSKFLRNVNLLSFFDSTKPVSVIGLSLKYHYRPSVFTGGFLGTAGSMLFYALLLSGFVGLGTYLGVESFHIFFASQFVLGNTLRILAGGAMFVLSLYLLKFGLGTAFTVFASILRRFPVRTVGLIVASLDALSIISLGTWSLPVVIAISVFMIFEDEIAKGINNSSLGRRFFAWVEKQAMFTTSKAFWHKIRESWSHAAWFQAYPRWAGGFPQKMRDKIIDRKSTRLNSSHTDISRMPSSA